MRSHTEDRREADGVADLDAFATEFELPDDVTTADAAAATDDAEG